MAVTVRSIVSHFASYPGDFIAGLSMAGVNVDAAVPMKADPAAPAPVVITTATLVDVLKRVGGHLKFNEKIQAIKVMREFTGLGLKESKDIVDLFPSGPNPARY